MLVGMERCDYEIKELGYVLVKHEPEICSMTYRNIKKDVEVTIEWAEHFNRDEDVIYGGMIYAQTISVIDDYYEQPFHLPIGLTQDEYRKFNKKLEWMIDMAMKELRRKKMLEERENE